MYLTVTAAICLFVFTQSFFSQQSVSREGSRTLTVEAEKTTYYLLEPIPINLKGTLRPANISRIADAVSVIITYNGESKVYQGVHPFITQGAPQDLPGGKVLTTKDSDGSAQYFEAAVYVDRVKEFFPNPGNYKLQLRIDGTASNVVDLTIEKPKDERDLAAFNFLNAFSDPLTFAWIWRDKSGVNLLESFVTDFGETPYGDIALSHLGFAYLAQNEFDKARIAFEKLKSSKNRSLAEEATQGLVEIARRTQIHD